MPEILDLYGNPVKKSLLRQEQATPTMSGVRTILNEHTSYGLDPYKLGQILHEADNGNHIDRYLGLAEEIEEKESHYHSVLGTRKRSVSQLDITVEPAGDDKESIRHAEFIESWLDRDCLEDELVDILDAIGKGFSATEIMWETSESQWLPSELKRRDPRWFKFDRHDGETLYLRNNAGVEPLSPYKFIIHKHRAKSGLPIRGGVVRPVFWMYLFKNFSIKDWITFAEAYGQPIRVGKYGSGASEEDRRVLLRAVANIGSDAAAIIPDSMEMEFIEAQNKSQTADVFEKLCRYIDEQISKIVLGQTMTTDNGSSRSQADVHNEVKHDIERSDAKQLAATLNRQLVQPIINLNFGARAKYPRIRIGRSENVDIEKVMNAADKGVRFGMRISEKGLREKVGFSAPESDDDTLRLPVSGQTASPAGQEDTAAQQKHQHHDAIDDLADTASADWEETLNPFKAAVEKAARESGSYEEFQQKLLEIAGELDLADAAEQIAQVNFTGNIAGQVDYDIEED
ncbi:MAG: DUF935 domain-containing protein [Alphaproteobacteria bacterium]|jgi:phage gp29-like protein|nr:DUF935 domain-containing protein [Alphaproteobacteria bacterium]